MPVLQPQMGELLTAMLSDNDGVTSDSYEWQWYRGSTEIIGATGTDATSTYTPVQADIGINLTAKATYTDGKKLQRQGHGRGHHDNGGASRP